MMLTNVLALTLSLAAPHQEAPTAKQLVEKMLVRYNSATTVAGTIHLTVAAGNNSASMDTALQFERPAKLYISQHKNVANPDPDQPNRWLVTSDGKSFSYDAPFDENSLLHTAAGTRLKEDIYNKRNGITSDIGSIYLAAGKSLGDRSMPLDIAISRLDDLKFRRNQWVPPYNVISQKEIRGKTAYIVQGDYRDYAGVQPTGIFQMAITADGDLLQYVQKQKLQIDGHAIELTSQWDVDLKVNGPVDATLFKVVISY